MNRHHVLCVPCFLIAALSQTGCSMEAGEDASENIGETQQADNTTNSLTSNSLTSNSLTSNSLTSNSLTSNALTISALTADSPVLTALNEDANSREVFHYIVGCALAAGDYIDIPLTGSTLRFYGELGIASSWKADGYCDARCQVAVSSCVLARVNYLGVPVPISVRGGPAHLGANGPLEAITYTQREAAYFGNIFKNPQERFTCLPAGKSSIPRVCGPSLSGCVVESVGTCNCAVNDDGSGAFESCNFPGYPGVSPLTVFLAP